MGAGLPQDLHGYLNVLKPPGWTSHDVVARLRRLSGQRGAGHAGTLDPAAVGVLPVAFGRATRTTSSPELSPKVYWADISFGAATDTDDAEGRSIATGSPEELRLDDLRGALERFVGDIVQVPPAYSAVHVGGRRAYVHARRGAEVRLPPRSVRIDAIGVGGWKPPVLSLVIQCGSGAYIRSIARDLGAAIGCPAHVSGLVRTRVGPFSITDSLDLDTIEAITERGTLQCALWPFDVVARRAPAILASASRSVDYSHGRAWRKTSWDGEGAGPAGARAYLEGGALLGFVVSEASGSWRPARGLALAAGEPSE